MEERRKHFLTDLGSYVSILIYVVTAIAKLVFAAVFQSTALFADGLNSASDVVSTIIILVGGKLSRRPGDDNHRYGHKRIEQIAAMIASFIMFYIGIQAFMAGIEKMISPQLEAPNLLAAVVAGVSALLIFGSALLNFKLFEQTKMMSNKVVAKHNISDALTALGAVIAIVAAQLNMPWIDPLASLVIAFFILQTAYEIFMEASNQLIDGFDTADLVHFNNLIATVPKVEKIQQLRGRKLGDTINVEVTIEVDGRMSVFEGHNIADQVEAVLITQTDVRHVVVHVEPNNNH
ncbi:MAG: cation diffusion facilitator family transporter [Culicoidibacterales bacterium]